MAVCALVVCLLALPLVTSPLRAAETTAFAFVDVAVLPMDRERVLQGQTVVVRDGVIVELGPRGTVGIPVDARLIDGRGELWLMPGLADMHVHLMRDGGAWLPLFLASGVTTVLNMSGTPGHLMLRAAVREGSLAGPTIYSTGPFIGQYSSITPDQAERLVAEHHEAGYDFIKVYSRNPGDWTEAAYERLIATARARGIPVTGHAPRNHDLDLVLEAGEQSIAHAEELIYSHLRDLEESRIADLADRAGAAGLSVITTLAANERIAAQWGRPEAVEAALEQPTARQLHPSLKRYWRHNNPYIGRRSERQRTEAIDRFLGPLVKGLHAGGVRLIAGTDAPLPLVMPGAALHRELELLQQAGLTPFEAISAATRHAGDFIAEELHAAEPFGRVAPGHRADLILLAGNPLEDLTALRSPLGVMARGRWFDKARLAALLEEMAGEFAKPAKRLEDAKGARLVRTDLETLLPGATLSGTNLDGIGYRMTLHPDGRLSAVTGWIGERLRSGTWWIDDDEYCRKYDDGQALCLAGVLDGKTVTWHVDVGGLFNRLYIRFREERLKTP